MKGYFGPLNHQSMTNLTYAQAVLIANDYQFIIGTDASPELPFKVFSVELFHEHADIYSVIFKADVPGGREFKGYLLSYLMDHNLDFDYEKYHVVPRRKS